MKKGLLFVIVILILASCRTVYSVHKRAAKRYQSKTHTVTHKGRNCHRPKSIAKSKNDHVPFHTEADFKSRVKHKADSIIEKNNYFSEGDKNKAYRTALDLVPVGPVAEYIHSYTVANGLPFPQYFITGTTNLVNFLSSFPSSQIPQYLHVYLCMNNTTSLVDLAIVGASANASNDGFIDVPYITGNVPMVFGNFSSSITCGVVRDPNMEGAYNYSNYPPQNLPPVSGQLINTVTATNRIDTYEAEVNQFPLAYSFMINTGFNSDNNTDSLLMFLNNTNNCQYNYGHPGQEAAHPLRYIQIYMAYDNNDPNQSTIILVGLDADGNHVYFNAGTQAQPNLEVFNTGMPCPYCTVSTILNVPSQ